MSKREPVAEIGAEDYRIVRHTHDIELARQLMAIRLDKEYGPDEEYGQPEFGQPEFGPRKLGEPSLAWIRVVPALPNSYAAAEGWSFTYNVARPGTRGAFPAVVFL